jgi:hypothetical protein
VTDGLKTGVSPISGTAPPVEHQFKPGNPGGPGRKPWKHITEAMKERIESGVDDTDLVIKKLYEDGFNPGHSEPAIRNAARKLYLAYAHGAPKQTIDLNNSGSIEVYKARIPSNNRGQKD